MAAREHLFTCKMSKAEMAALVKLARHYGITLSDLVRMLVRRDVDVIAAKKGGKD